MSMASASEVLLLGVLCFRVSSLDNHFKEALHYYTTSMNFGFGIMIK